VKTWLSPILLCLLFLPCCEKENSGDQHETSDGYIETFVSLVAEKDSLYPGESTKIRAQVEGDHIHYAWEATQGDILGDGREVTYVALLCECGKSRIDCRASAGSYSAAKSVIIYILEDE